MHPQTRDTLADGTSIGFRPIKPDDAHRLVDAFNQMSPMSRYRRFLAPVRSLSDAEVHRFTDVDFVDHVAWVAELLGEALHAACSPSTRACWPTISQRAHC